MLVDGGKQWFKSIGGWDVAELSETKALCSWAIDIPGITLIEDLLKDTRTAEHPLVRTQPRFRFYAGCPLLDHDDWPIGALYVLDIKPRRFSDRKRQVLLDLAELVQREITWTGTASPDSSLATKLSIVRREALIDPLTRLWNRRGADDLLAGALKRADDRSFPLALAVIDIDDLRGINTRYGRQGGDEVLRKLAARLLTAIRVGDTAFHLADGRFLLLMTDLGATVAARVLERVCWTLCETGITTASGDVPVSVTTALVCRAPGDSATVAELVTQLGEALSRSKASRSAVNAPEASVSA